MNKGFAHLVFSNEGCQLKKFKSTTNNHFPRKLISIAVFCILLIVAFALFRFIDPFQSLDPLHREVTPGEKVIDNWTYNGMNGKGELVFANGHDNVPDLIPASDHMFALDGQTFVIEEASSNSLTFSEPIESLPYLWMIAILGVLGFFALFITRRRKRKAFNVKK